jgi:peptidoglycan/xylan/chitin deacetylase (PgdA/CDA1 family)
MRGLVLACLGLACLVLAGCGGGGSRAPGGSPRTVAPPPRTDPAAVAAQADVPVLCWHQIRRQTAADSARDRQYIVSPAAFAAQMRALDRAGYHPVNGEALVAHVARGAPLPRKPVLLTFDDASAEQYDAALPVLRRHHFVATFFVMTVVLDKPGWLSSARVRALDRAGMTIGAHTWDHRPVPGYAGGDWRIQITEPTRRLARLVGHPIRLFAYPYGLWSPAAFAHLRRAGFTAAFQLADRLDRRNALWTLRRIIVPQVPGSTLLREVRRDFSPPGA